MVGRRDTEALGEIVEKIMSGPVGILADLVELIGPRDGADRKFRMKI